MLILCGYLSCGKKILAKAYHRAFACPYIDTDHLIIQAIPTRLGEHFSIRSIHQTF